MRDWIKQTFSSGKGGASFKRQALFLIVLSAIIATFKKIDVTALTVLAGVIAALTTAEKSKKL